MALQCWHWEAAERPRVAELAVMLGQIKFAPSDGYGGDEEAATMTETSMA